MLVNPFWFGVFIGMVLEFAVLIIVAYFSAKGGEDDKDDHNDKKRS